MHELLGLLIKTIIATLLIFALFCAIRTLIPSDHIMTELHPMDEQRMKTGDLLTVAYPRIHGHLVKIFNGSMWTHSGLVAKSGKDIYVWEMCGYCAVTNKDTGEKYPGREHICKVPLKEWLYRNRRQIIARTPYNGPTLDPKKVDSIYHRLQLTVKQDIFVINWIKVLKRWPYENNIPPRKMFCTQLVAYVLQELNVLTKEWDACSFSPHDFVFSKGRYVSDNTYGESRLIHIPK